MGHVLCSRAELKHRQKLGAGIDGQPEPQDLLGVAQPGAQFVQLQVRKVEGAEAVLVQGLCMFPCASQPRGDGGLSVALRPASPPKDPALRPAQRAPRRPGEKGFSDGTKACGVEH
jgi:hypothetical protein